MQKVLAIVGPTAIGKTDLAISLAQKLNGEIISGDSMQVYQEVEVGTAKATKEEQAKVKPYVVDNRSVFDEYSVKDFGDEAKKALAALGIEALEMTVTSTNDVQQVTESIVKQVDALYIPTDNTFAASMSTVKTIVEKSKTVVVTGSVDDAATGGLATFGIDYEKLGRQTARQAIQILKDGKKPADIPVETAEDLTLFVNEEMAKVLGIDPATIKLG